VRGAVISTIRIDAIPDPVVPSERWGCADCHEPVWLSLATKAYVLEIEGELPPLVCEVCILGHIAGVSRS
jgi:hypothetical protein